MDEDEVKRRASSPRIAAMRRERMALVAVRRQMSDFQKRAAFIEARATSARGHDPETIKAEIEELGKAVRQALDQVEVVMEGQEGAGPAEDCRKALRQIRDRLPRL